MQDHPATEQLRQRYLAIALTCGAGFFFCLLDATAKYLSNSDIPLSQIVWVRFLGHAVLSLLLLGPHRLPALARTAKPLVQWVRSGFMLGATLCNFVAVSFLPLDVTATIFFLSPLIVAVIAGPLLGEWIGWRRMTAVLVGFCGILIVVRPGFGMMHWAVLVSLGAPLCYGLYNVATRYLAAFDSSGTTQFYTPLAGLLVMTPLALSDWVWPRDIASWGLLLWLGATGAFGHWLFIQAAARAPAPVISPFFYVNIIWMTALGYFIFADLPDAATLAGAAIIVSSGLYLLYRERQTRGA